jgi:hypothetical protein
MNLVLAFFWLLLGIYLYLNEESFRRGPVAIPLHYFVFALVLYNLWRWSVVRSQRNSRRAEQERQRQQSERRRERDRPRDPTFDFEADDIPLRRNDDPPGKNGD